MARRGKTLRRGAVKLTMDYEGVGEMLNSDAMEYLMEQTAKDIVDNVQPEGRGSVEVTNEQADPSKNNRARQIVRFEYHNPQQKNRLISAAIRTNAQNRKI